MRVLTVVGGSLVAVLEVGAAVSDILSYLTG